MDSQPIGFRATIHLPGGIVPLRYLTCYVATESEAWDQARAACSPSERVAEMKALNRMTMPTLAELEARLTREHVRLEAANGEAWTEIAGNIAALAAMITRLKERGNG